MKFSINQSELATALGIVAKGSSQRSTLSILAGIYIEARQNSITLQSTNLELAIKHELPALVEESGETVVPARLFQDIVKNLPDRAINFATGEAGLSVFCDNINYSLKTLDPLDFPSFPELTAEKETSVPFTVFSSMIKGTARVTSSDESRPILTGVLVRQMGTNLTLVATDSYRLAVAEHTLSTSTPETFEAVVPGNFLTDIAALPTSEEQVKLALNDNQIIVTYNNTTFINRRIEGVFPNYQQLIGGEHTTRVTLPVRELQDAIRRVALISSKLTPVQFKVDTDGNIITLFTHSQDIGNAQETILCDVQGESVDIAFSHTYILDGLAAIQSENVYLDLFGPMKPGILRATEGEEYLYLIMPVRV